MLPFYLFSVSFHSFPIFCLSVDLKGRRQIHGSLYTDISQHKGPNSLVISIPIPNYWGGGESEGISLGQGAYLDLNNSVLGRG